MEMMVLHCPRPVQSQVGGLCSELIEAIGENLVGIYLHGSLALGCFNPTSSDIDLLVIISQPMDIDIKRDVAQKLLLFSCRPRPVEITFVTEPALGSGRYPVPFDLHYGEDWRQQTQAQLDDGSWRLWNEVERKDPDLAGQIAVTRDRGICLAGLPISEIMPVVPDDATRQCFSEETAWAVERVRENPVYGILNPCRAWAYFCEGKLLSKAEGGEWALPRLSEPHRAVVMQALAAYRSTAESITVERAGAASCAAYIGDQVRNIAPAAQANPAK